MSETKTAAPSSAFAALASSTPAATPAQGTLTPAAQPASTPSKTASGWVDHNGQFADGWHKNLGEGFDSLSKFKTAEGLAKSYANLEREFGKKVLTPPTKDSPPEYVQKFREQFDIPNDAKDYKTLDALKDIKDFKPDEATLGKFEQVAHGLNLSKSQAKELVKWQAQLTQESVKTYTEQQQMEAVKQKDACISDLKQTFGAEVSKAMESAQRAVKMFGSEEMFSTAKYGNDPQFLKMMAAIGNTLKEGKLIGSSDTETSMTLRDQVNTLMKNPAYFNRSNPEHSQIRSKVDGLWKQIANIENLNRPFNK